MLFLALRAGIKCPERGGAYVAHHKSAVGLWQHARGGGRAARLIVLRLELGRTGRGTQADLAALAPEIHAYVAMAIAIATDIRVSDLQRAPHTLGHDHSSSSEPSERAAKASS